MACNFGDFQNQVYAEAVQGVTTRYPFDFASIERKASEALPDWVYRYVSAAAGDGRTQRANIAAFSCYGLVPRSRQASRLLRDAIPQRVCARFPADRPARWFHRSRVGRDVRLRGTLGLPVTPWPGYPACAGAS